MVSELLIGNRGEITMRRGVRTGRPRLLTALVAVVGAFMLLDAGQALPASAQAATTGASTQVSNSGTTGLGACGHRIRHRKHLTGKQIRIRKQHWARLCRQARAAAAAAARQAAYTASITATASPSRACGATTYTKADGTAYACTFADEFSGSALDATKWSPILTAVTGQRTGYECVVDTPDTLAVSGNALTITARRLSSPMTCASPFGDFSTSFTGGMITTSRKYAQAYGRFEMRARFPQTTVAGVQSSLWMFPQDLTYGAWPASGEIDIAEWFSGWGDLVVPHLHYTCELNDLFRTSYNCKLGDPAGYHTYAVDWTPTSIAFIYDGQTCLRNVNWLPEGLLAPAPFDKPFNLLIGNGRGTGNNEPSAATPFPSALQVDYVRAWS